MIVRNCKTLKRTFSGKQISGKGIEKDMPNAKDSEADQIAKRRTE
jgi:hypothetical protein